MEQSLGFVTEMLLILKVVTDCERDVQYVTSNMSGTGNELCKITKSQNKLDRREQPVKEDQQISGRLKSPTRIMNFH